MFKSFYITTFIRRLVAFEDFLTLFLLQSIVFLMKSNKLETHPRLGLLVIQEKHLRTTPLRLFSAD